MDGSEEDAVLTLAAKAAVDSILACQVSNNCQETIYAAFRSISSFRLCIASLPGSDVLLSSNLLFGGEVMFTPVLAETSCTRDVASQCRPSFITGNNASRCSDLSVILKQETSKAFFCVPLPTNYHPALNGQASSLSTRVDTESVCLGAIIIGFQAEHEVAEQDLRATLLIARLIAVNHHSRLESLIAVIAPILNTENDPNYHPGWGNAGGLLRPMRRQRNSSSATAATTNGAGGSRLQASGSTYIDNSHPAVDPLDTSDEEEELMLTESSSASLILNPIQHALLQSTGRLSLAFPHLSLEKQYQEWRSARMARVDGAALATLLAYHYTRTLASSGSRSSTATFGGGGSRDGESILSTLLFHFTALSHWEYLPCTIIIIPILLTLFPATHRWYSQRRDTFIAVLYIVLAWHHIIAGASLAANSTSSTSTSFWNYSTKDSSNSAFDIVAQQQQNHHHHQQPLHLGCSATRALIGSTTILIEMLSNMDSIWISVLSVILNVRHPWQTVMLFMAATLSALIGPVCPPGVGVVVGGGGGDRAVELVCWIGIAAKMLFVQMIIPGIALYWLEYGARRAFCATPAASYFAWKLEGVRSSAQR